MNPANERVALASITKYKPGDMRIELAKKTIVTAVDSGYPIVVVDESPPEVSSILENLPVPRSGLYLFQKGKGGTMGCAKRQALRIATTRVEKGISGIVIWMEAEKWTFISLIRNLLLRTTAKDDLVVPRRESMDSYPELQALNEPFANRLIQIATGFPVRLDMFFGPLVIPVKNMGFFLEYKGEHGDLWDCLQIPVVRMIAKGLSIASIPVDYRHPEEQKMEETLGMAQRRVDQIANIFGAVKKEAIRLGLQGA